MSDARIVRVVEVETVIEHQVDHVWRVLTTDDGVEALLGQGARLGGKGETWHADDGSHGVWRSYHPDEQVRVSWHADAAAPRSLVDLKLIPEGTGTRMSLRHDLSGALALGTETADPTEAPGPTDTALLQQRWSAALDRLGALVT